jgi:hypothetical protein
LSDAVLWPCFADAALEGVGLSKTLSSSVAPIQRGSRSSFVGTAGG